MPKQIFAVQYEVSEWGYVSGKAYADPFNNVELDVVLTSSKGQWRVPTYWAGGNEWRVRFAPPEAGTYQVTTVCSDKSNPDLHGQASSLEATAYRGNDPLLAHGPLRIAASKRTIEHADGTPLFWLGDTWWMGLCKRWSWPDDFKLMTADRVAKGFTVIQIVAGLYPDMPPFDERGANEAGFPWEKDFTRINPAYFDMADLRIQWLARSGLVPCIVSCWGYFLPLMGVEKMKQHLRNMIARWGAYPVIWCLAGEATMPYYLSKNPEQDRQAQMDGWTEVGQYVRQVDPYHRLVTIHPTQVGRDQVKDESVLDINMLQTGHGGYGSISNTIVSVTRERSRQPVMPVLVGEVSYEGILHESTAEVQRLAFWASMLCGAAGHTYGGNGIWQVNTRQKPFGASPWGGTWGSIPWEEVYRLPGSTQLGLAKGLLQRYAWWRFEPHQEWVKPAGGPQNLNAPFAAGIPGEVRVIYFYYPTYQKPAEQNQVLNIEPGIRYKAFFWRPRDGEEYDLGIIKPDASGTWEIPIQPTLEDWVVVIESIRG
jgi:hypothetical protein